MTKLRLTLVVDYEANDEFYDECAGDPKKMADLDQCSFDEGDLSVEELITNGDVIEVRFEPSIW